MRSGAESYFPLPVWGSKLKNLPLFQSICKNKFDPPPGTFDSLSSVKAYGAARGTVADVKKITLFTLDA